MTNKQAIQTITSGFSIEALERLIQGLCEKYRPSKSDESHLLTTKLTVRRGARETKARKRASPSRVLKEAQTLVEPPRNHAENFGNTRL